MAATPAHAEVQNLLRFLTKDARLPLAEAMPKIHPLRKMQLQTPEAISQAQSADLKVIFTDDKILKQVVSAAKRASNPKKRAPAKSRTKQRSDGPTNPEDEEAALELPTTDKIEIELRDVRIETNRAPLFLAFAIVVLTYTHTDQPLSSRLSLAQAVVSAGAQSKAKYLGLSEGPTAEEDGWAQGQPKTYIMGREVAVMRRHIPTSVSADTDAAETPTASSSHDAFWGIDLEALRKSNGPLIAGKNAKGHTGPPVHTPQSARNYLLKSMLPVKEKKDNADESVSKKTTNAAATIALKEEAAAMVLKAIDIVCNSWKDSLTPTELDRRAQTWYSLVRPEVAQGQAGWGQRGQIKLDDILRLKRTP